MKSRLAMALMLTTLAGAGAFALNAQAQQPPAPPPGPSEAAPPPPPGPDARGPEGRPGDRGPGMRADRGPGMGRGRGPQMSPEDRAAFFDARLAAVKAGLQLTPDQEKMWPPVESAVRDMVKQGMEARQKRAAETPPANPVERMARMGEMQTRRGEAMTKLADAARPLYASLDDGQKRRLMMLVRPMRGGRGHEGMRGRERHGMHSHRMDERHGMDRHGMDRHGMDRHGMDRHGMGDRRDRFTQDDRERGGWRERHHGDRRGDRGDRRDGPRENYGPFGMNDFGPM